MSKEYLREVEERLKSARPAKASSPWLAEDYVGGGQSRLQYLNLKIPLVRAVYKKGFSFSHLPDEELWAVWDYIWKHSQIFEVMLLSSYWVSSRSLEDLLNHKKIILSWLDRVDNWAHSDEMSAHYAKLFEHEPKIMKTVFEKWNRSKNPWMRRQSIVGILFYSRFRKRAPDANFILKLVDELIEDDHYYVQKGVGWALRECWNVYPEKTFRYLKKNAHRIPPAGWTAATEKLSLSEKKVLKSLRQS